MNKKLIKELKCRNIWLKFVANMLDTSDAVGVGRYSNSYANAIAIAMDESITNLDIFVWGRSPEGHEYWRGVSNKLVNEGIITSTYSLGLLEYT